jgi:hypothetical protein
MHQAGLASTYLMTRFHQLGPSQEQGTSSQECSQQGRFDPPYGGHEATVQQLLNRAADKEARTNSGSTAVAMTPSSGYSSNTPAQIRR